MNPRPVSPAEQRSAVIDLNAVRHNVRRLIQLARGRELIAVVKADAYGHGAPQVARAALDAGATMLGTAHVSEALALRASGIESRLLAWLHTSGTDFVSAVEQDVAVGISGGELDAVLAAARAVDKPAVLHLKIDTGLGRNGATVERWPELLGRVAAAQHEGLVDVEGIFTHLAVADEPERMPETLTQLNALTEAVELARAEGIRPRMVHAANTPGLVTAELLDDPGLMLRDAVRVGLGLYGLSPLADRTPENLGLIPAMTMRTRVAGVKTVQRGQGVSYGLAYRTADVTSLALIPVGYADGVPRVATGAPVLINGRSYPVVGRIAMDQMVVDLADGGHPTVRAGDDAVLFGPVGSPSVTDWADAAGSINYEIVTRISQRVPREYVDGTETVRPRWTRTFHPATAHETQVLAERLAPHLRAGDLVLLNGELGAGKTTFTQGLGRGLGVREGITSPTFVLSRRHPNDPHGPRAGGPDLVHVDAYRLDSAADIDNIDLEDTVDTCVTVVEWGTDKVEHLSPSRLVIDIERPRGAGAAASDTSGTSAASAGATPGGRGASDVADLLRDLNAEWDSEDADEDDPRTIVITGHGPRWEEPLAL